MKSRLLANTSNLLFNLKHHHPRVPKPKETPTHKLTRNHHENQVPAPQRAPRNPVDHVPAGRGQWGSMKNTKSNAKQDMLNLIREKVGGIITSEQWQEALKFRSKLSSYSFLNTLLIYTQMPEATAIAGYKKWLNDFNRQVNKGEKGIRILAPMIRTVTNDNGQEERRVTGFRSVAVFDVAQTSGDPIPTRPQPEVLEDDSPHTRELLNRALAYTRSLGHPIVFEDLKGGFMGYYRPSDNTIGLNENVPPLQQLKTLIHELAHAVFGHGGDGDSSTREYKELEAETTAFMVLNDLGIDTSRYSFTYLAHYASEDLDELMAAGEKAHRIAKSITAALEGEVLPEDTGEVERTENPQKAPEDTCSAGAAG